MEGNSLNIVISSNKISTLKNSDDGFVPKKKKRGPMHVFKVALYMIKSRNSKKQKSASVDTVSIWQKFFGLGHSPPLLMGEATGVAPVVEHLEVFTPPMSPAQASVASASSCGMSQYASATNLQMLDEGDESDEENQEFGDKEGDEMIDLKAEQFIAQFYHQMRLQDEAYTNRRNSRMSGIH